MIKSIVKVFKYIEPIWLGANDQVSIRRILALIFSINMVDNISFAIHRWEIGKSYSDVAMLIGIEAALIAALLTLTTYSSFLKTQNHDRPYNYPEDPNFAPENPGHSERHVRKSNRTRS